MRDGTTVYCLLGSNLGERLTFLRRAAFALACAEGIELVRASSVYETAPWGKADQPPYLNAVLELITALAPLALLDCFQEVERRLGRVSGKERWTERVIDLDILLYSSEVIQTDRLTVPHAHLKERAFALVPLLEVAPNLKEPLTEHPYREALRELENRLEAGDLRLEKQREESPEPQKSLKSPASSLKSQESLKPQPSSLKPSVSAAIEPLITEVRDMRTADASSLLVRSISPEETEKFAEVFAAGLRGKEVVALAGDLGAGKTCFARGLARGLGIPGPITSPSYVLVKSYEGRLTFHHADFYRLEGSCAVPVPSSPSTASTRSTPSTASALPEPLDLASLGLDDYLDDPDAVVLIEWADRYPQWLEPPFTLIEIAGAGSNPRFVLVRRIAQRD
jgi:2-amino-4-hydroxy-6-hydroxymethyldihydropteridine diphosphokinase